MVLTTATIGLGAPGIPPPLTAMTMERLPAQQWRSAALWCLPLVLVKEDLGLTVAAVGGYLLLRGQRGWGSTLIGWGAACFALTVWVLVSAMNSRGNYDYWAKLGGGSSFPALLSPLFSGIEVKLQTFVVLLGVTGMLAVRSPLSLLVVLTLFWRFTSTDRVYWGTGWHYSAVLMPMVFGALADGLLASKASPRRQVRGYAGNLVPAVLVVSITFTLAGCPVPAPGQQVRARVRRGGLRSHAAPGLTPAE